MTASGLEASGRELSIHFNEGVEVPSAPRRPRVCAQESECMRMHTQEPVHADSVPGNAECFFSSHLILTAS